jgi:hypothetical protein
MNLTEYLKISAVVEVFNKEGRISSDLTKTFIKTQEEKVKLLKKFLKFRSKIPKSIELGKQIKIEDKKYTVVGFGPEIKNNKLVWQFVELVNNETNEKIEITINQALKGK